MRIVRMVRIAGPAQPYSASALDRRGPPRAVGRAQIRGLAGHRIDSRTEQVRHAHQRRMGIDLQRRVTGGQNRRCIRQGLEQRRQLRMALQENGRAARLQLRRIAGELDGIAEALLCQQ